MNRYKYLLKNIGLLTFSNFATKMLSFFLVPLYTNLLTTTEYGTYDLFNTTIGVLLPIFTFNIQEAVLRFSIDSQFSRQSIVTVATRYLFISNLLVVGGLGINAIFRINELVYGYSFFFFLMYLVQSLSSILIMYVRGIDKIKELSISSVLASAFTIALNILFLAIFKLGLTGYFLANIFGPLLQCAYLMFKVNVFDEIRLHEKFKKERLAMVYYSRPLIANSIAWWVNNVSDRYVVIFFCGLAENGIYSVATKIPSILNIFQTIFNQAWTLSAVRDFDAEDKDNFFTNTYRVYNCLMVIVCSVIIVVDKFLAKFLYANDFYIAWKFVPWLTIAILFGAISGYIGGFFAAAKDSKIFARSTLYGAFTNIILNLLLVPFVGVLGASIATAVSYIEVWAFRYWHSRKYIKINNRLIRDCLAYSILILQSVALLFIYQDLVLYMIELTLFVIVLCLHIDDISLLIRARHKKL